eukprot:1160671-Pelagomonas_calceolata.AAC.8
MPDVSQHVCLAGALRPSTGSQFPAGGQASALSNKFNMRTRKLFCRGPAALNSWSIPCTLQPSGGSSPPASNQEHVMLWWCDLGD